MLAQLPDQATHFNNASNHRVLGVHLALRDADLASVAVVALCI
jgi:hypothetical protein